MVIDFTIKWIYCKKISHLKKLLIFDRRQKLSHKQLRYLFIDVNNNFPPTHILMNFCTKTKEPRLSHYLPKAGERKKINTFTPNETQTT